MENGSNNYINSGVVPYISGKAFSMMDAYEYRVYSLLHMEYRQARHRAKGKDWARCYYQSLDQIAEKTGIDAWRLEDYKVMTSLRNKGLIHTFRNWNGASHIVVLDPADKYYQYSIENLTRLDKKLALMKSLRRKAKQEVNTELEADASSLLFYKDNGITNYEERTNTESLREDKRDNSVHNSGDGRCESVDAREARPSSRGRDGIQMGVSERDRIRPDSAKLDGLDDWVERIVGGVPLVSSYKGKLFYFTSDKKCPFYMVGSGYEEVVSKSAIHRTANH